MLSHEQLIELVIFDLTEKNRCWVLGRWCVHTECIPTGGQLNAQAADLYSVWQANQKRGLFRTLGTMIALGIPLLGGIAHCSFVLI